MLKLLKNMRKREILMAMLCAVLAAGAALTDAHKVILRGQNIVFDQPETTSTFSNKTTGT